MEPLTKQRWLEANAYGKELFVDEALAENARLQEQVKEAERELAEHGCLKVEREAFRARDRYKALAERRKEALDAWGRYSLSSKPSKELLVEALRLTDAAEEPR